MNHLRLKKGKFLSPFFGSQGGYQRHLLGSFLLVSVVLFFVFSVLVLNAADRRYREEIHEIGQRTITQAQNTSNTFLLGIFNYAWQSVTYDTELAQWMYKESFDINDALSATSILNDLQRTNSYVDNFYILNYTTQIILTKAGSKRISAFPDKEFLDVISDIKPSRIPVRYIPRIATSKDAYGHISQKRYGL